MGLYKLARNRTFRNFMSRLYGWGAAVVILGALFKINHYPYADHLLLVGLSLEAIIFAFSAFEQPHVDPDWSLVYPELYNDFHGKNGDVTPAKKGLTSKLDEMLNSSNIDSKLIDNLGRGLEKFSQHTSDLANISDAAIASSDYAEQTRKIADSLSSLNRIYEKQLVNSNQQVESSTKLHETMNMFLENLSESADKMIVYKDNMDQLNEKMTALNEVYGNMLTAMNVKNNNSN